MSTTESVVLTAVGSVPLVFGLRGGRYGVLAISTNWGGDSLMLNTLAADGVTWVSVPFQVITDFTGAASNGYEPMDLMPGVYNIATGGTATGVKVSFAQIPGSGL